MIRNGVGSERQEPGPDFLDEAVRLLQRGLRSEIAALQAAGERYPVAFIVDGGSRPARQLKWLLPEPPGQCPDDPGTCVVCAHKLGRECLEKVLHRGYLLDHPGDADPNTSFWQVMVIQEELQVILFTCEDGKEKALQHSTFPLKG
jgi:hypothetical protein